MGLRTASARWFEILTPRDQLTGALHCLARSGVVELQSHSQTTSRAVLPDLRRGLEQYGELRRRYGTWWPPGHPPTEETRAEPARRMEKSLAVVRAWTEEADPLILGLQGVDRMIEDLRLLADALSGDEAGLPDLSQFAKAGPWLAGRLYLLPTDAQIQQFPTAVLVQPVHTETHRFLLALGEAAAIEQLDEQMAALRARSLVLPGWLPGSAREAHRLVMERLGHAQDERRELENRLDGISRRHHLAEALGELRLLDWYATHVPELPVTEQFAWITGWTSDPEGVELDKCLKASGVNYLLRLTEPPPDVEHPMVLRNPSWARPFELFARLMGTPGEGEVDPSPILAIMAPLMFGYMFGDVGQGAVLLIAGLLLFRRVPALTLLIPGGLSAIIFGLAFGSVFGNEHLIPALWVHPLEDPLPVLAASLGFGVLVVLLGLGLDALQHHWQGDARGYWLSRVGLPVTYFGILGAVFVADALWLVAAGAVIVIGGAVLADREHDPAAAGEAAVEYGETVLQLVVNTVSFVRVGAFALAHCGLSAAVVGIAEAAGSPGGHVAALVLGNALVIGLEGLVVGIQTTRLVLFEFFIRFLKASGRRFQPLIGPDGPINPSARRES